MCVCVFNFLRGVYSIWFSRPFCPATHYSFISLKHVHERPALSYEIYDLAITLSRSTAPRRHLNTLNQLCLRGTITQKLKKTKTRVCVFVLFLFTAFR